MTVTLPTAPPTAAIAGDTWAWTDTSTIYPASEGWVLSYVLAGPNVLEWDPAWATVSGGTTTIDIPGTATRALAAGTYRLTAIYTLGATRYSVRCGAVTVAADPASLAAGDTVSWAERTLAVIEAFLGGHLEGGVQYYMIGTRQVGAIPLEDLWKIRRNLQAEVAAQRRGATGLLGTGIAFHYHQPGVIHDEGGL